MPTDAYVADRCSEIQENLRYAAEKSSADAELGAYLAAYISVLISGVVEDCIEYLVVQRARMARDPHLHEFVRSAIAQQFRNPQSNDIANVLGRFSESYKETYQASVPTASREALGSVVRNRLLLAHSGRSQQDFTVAEVGQYFAQIVGILEIVESILLPASSPRSSLLDT